MARFDKQTTGALVRLLVFVVTTGLATGLLVATIGNFSFGSSKEYHAVFADATGVAKGDDVRVAGVRVGTVDDVALQPDARVEVTFSVAEDVRLDGATNATIRYRNLLGQRYIALTQDGRSSDTMAEGQTIPIARTQPSVDLTVLFNGFKPLFQALSPDDINQLSAEIVKVFQGEGGTVESLLASTASLTQTLADRDQVIGDLLDNLDYVLGHVADRDRQLTRLIGSFRTLVGGLKDDRQAILSSLDSISALSVQTASLAEDIHEPLVADVAQLRKTAALLDKGRAEIDRTLQVLPIKLNKIGRTATYGSWFNFYLCNLAVTVRNNGSVIARPVIDVGAERCSLGG
ncbi:MCE family protein [Nocardioides sp. GY 10113]|uniref:MCE family protein n=1 Tax=Nocardioides sp. GY 10113 TaxID=2569761 RepID=UPI0010A877CB|nr:MlaD family protein [Nocardioides sp. GY 10113]TIC89325.1 MCE family protein [Nocardioides sp. GY 10113]